MLCAISGVVPEEPVVTPAGYLYEKRLLLKAIEDTGREPTNGEELKREDVLEIKDHKAVRPRPISATSIPGLLQTFHNEWDAVMLEHHELRKQLQQRNQELSTALYEHDAAVRVIARLTRERDAARAALDTVQQQLPAVVPEARANGKRAAVEDGIEDAAEPVAKKSRNAMATEIPGNVLEELIATAKELGAPRKKRQAPPTLATVEEVAAQTATGYPLHSAAQGGILCIDLGPNDENIVATAGMDNTVQLFSRSDKRVFGQLLGHSKRVNAVSFLSEEDLLATASSDKTVKLWTSNAEGSGFKCAQTLTQHQGEVTGLALHPTKKYFVTSSADKSWCFWDIEQAAAISQLHDPDLTSGNTCAGFHPDGLILGTGSAEGTIKMWDLRQSKVASIFSHEEQRGVRTLSYSENGYFLASAAADGARLWDLRRLRNFKTLTPFSDVTCAVFDHSSMYLAVGGPQVQVYHVVKSEFTEVVSHADVGQKGVLSLKWGKDAKALLAGGADHKLRVME